MICWRIEDEILLNGEGKSTKNNIEMKKCAGLFAHFILIL